MLRLATLNPAATQSPPTAQAVLVVSNPNPWAASREQHHTPSGRLLPPLHRWDRLQLRTQHATKAWRALAYKLDAATAALAGSSVEDADQHLDEWRRVAMAILVSSDAKPADLRTLLAIASVLAGCRNPTGGAYRCRETNTEGDLALALVDWQLFRNDERRQR